MILDFLTWNFQVTVISRIIIQCFQNHKLFDNMLQLYCHFKASRNLFERFKSLLFKNLSNIWTTQYIDFSLAAVIISSEMFSIQINIIVSPFLSAPINNFKKFGAEHLDYDCWSPRDSSWFLLCKVLCLLLW